MSYSVSRCELDAAMTAKPEGAVSFVFAVRAGSNWRRSRVCLGKHAPGVFRRPSCALWPEPGSPPPLPAAGRKIELVLCLAELREQLAAQGFLKVRRGQQPCINVSATAGQ